MNTKILAMFVVVGFAQLVTGNTLAGYQVKFYKAEEQVQAAYTQQVAKIEAECESVITRLVEQAQKNGNLDAYLELTKFRDGMKRGIVPELAEVMHRDVVYVLKARKKALSNAEVARKVQMRQILSVYVRLLENLMADLTKAGSIEEAKKVSAELVLAKNTLAFYRPAAKSVRTPASTNTTVVKAVPSWRKGPDIPDDAVEWQGRHYSFFSDSLSWHDAKKKCEEMGGHLVTITSEEEGELVSRLAGNVRVWIGLTDEKKEGSWRWVTGEKFDYSNWGPRSPDNFGNAEHYVWVQKIAGGTRVWNDAKGGWPNAYVCEWENKKWR